MSQFEFLRKLGQTGSCPILRISNYYEQDGPFQTVWETFRLSLSFTRLEENRAFGLESTAMKWMKRHPYLSVTFAYLLLMVLMAVLAGSGLLHFDPEALGRLIGIAWVISILGVMFIRAVR